MKKLQHKTHKISYLNAASENLKDVVSCLSKVKDSRVEQIIHNLMEEENNLDTIIMNIEDENL